MKSAARLWICRFLVASMAVVPFAASAGMIATPDAVTMNVTPASRAQLIATVERADVASALKSLGVDMDEARVRVAAMTDQEVGGLAHRLDTLPAGGTTFVWAIAAAVAIAVMILYRYK